MTPKKNRLRQIFSLLFGLFLGLSLLKFGNPVILDKLINRPSGAFEWLLNSWPLSVGFTLLCGIIIAGLISARFSMNVCRIALLPLVWLVWQFISAAHTVSGELTRATLPHFVACVVCFYLGLFALSQTKWSGQFFVCLLLGLLVVIAVGWQQHFGGLEATRKYFFAHLYPQMTNVSPEYLKKISSDRIFSTLFYPNALAGAILLLLPVSLATIWQQRDLLTGGARGFLLGLVTIGAMACLYWSKSKGGWLVMLLLGLAALLRLRFEKRLKLILIAIILIVGLGGFALRFAGYFQKGATSVSARGDYWHAAVLTAAANPIFGTGPGTFAIPYSQIKRPDAEMARLVHNDYLQQASDSGLLGCLAYFILVAGGLWVTYRKSGQQDDWLQFSVWLGLLGWSLQSAIEFNLYIPALAWTAFALLGWLVGNGNEFDTAPKNHYRQLVE